VARRCYLRQSLGGGHEPVEACEVRAQERGWPRHRCRLGKLGTLLNLFGSSFVLQMDGAGWCDTATRVFVKWEEMTEEEAVASAACKDFQLVLSPNKELTPGGEIARSYQRSHVEIAINGQLLITLTCFWCGRLRNSCTKVRR
jgi:hypothetical protein